MDGIPANNVQLQQQRQTGGGGKAFASAFLPGLGQFCDNRNGAGAAYLGGSIATGTATSFLARSLMKDAFETVGDDAAKVARKSLTKWKAGGLIASVLAGGVLWIANIVDAYKGGKK